MLALYKSSFSYIIICVTHLQRIVQILNLIEFFKLAILKVLKICESVNFQINFRSQKWNLQHIN